MTASPFTTAADTQSEKQGLTPAQADALIKLVDEALPILKRIHDLIEESGEDNRQIGAEWMRSAFRYLETGYQIWRQSRHGP